MDMTHVVGVDPGLRDTGVVLVSFDSENRTTTSRAFVIDGQTAKADPSPITAWLGKHCSTAPHVFIEKFVPRPGMNTTPDMVELERVLHTALKRSKMIRNTGVKQVISPTLLEMLCIWKFDVVTNHDDLRAAARIALFGMVKDPVTNALLSDVVRDSLDGNPWDAVAEPGERYAP